MFPFTENRTYTPPDVPKERVFAFHDFLGFDRGVVVHSAPHGSNHAVLLDALAAGEGRYRGVALIDVSTPDEEIDELDRAGVCGFRMHFMSHLGAPPSHEEIDALLTRVGPRGWHVEIHVGGTGVSDHADLLRSMPVPTVIDHMARIDIANGLDTEPAHALMELLDTGHIWVKLSGIDRLSRQGPPYDDAVAFARRLMAHAPERALWGSDFPHPNITGPMPDDGVLVDRIADIAPDEAERERLLVTNPTEFFGFDRYTR